MLTMSVAHILTQPESTEITCIHGNCGNIGSAKPDFAIKKRA